MKYIIKILFFLVPTIVIGTPQEAEILIYGNDTIYMDYYPLEELRKKDKEVDNKLKSLFPAISSACWRGYNGTWKIEQDSLFLLKIEKCGVEKDSKHIDLRILFNESKIGDNGVFANWYSEIIRANYGEFLDYDDYSFIPEPIYTGRIICSISYGIVTGIEIKMKSQSEIDKIIKTRIAKEDTMVCVVVEVYPILLKNERKYQLGELDDLIQKQIRYPNNTGKCNGTVYISFIVEKDGSVSRKRIIRKLCPEQDEEAMRILNLMKKWEPGKIKGRVVRTQLMIPIRFKNE